MFRQDDPRFVFKAHMKRCAGMYQERNVFEMLNDDPNYNLDLLLPHIRKNKALPGPVVVNSTAMIVRSLL